MIPPFAVLLGPTASGKTSLCESLVDFPVEIINADTVQMYRVPRIGSARPPDSLLQRIPHHLLGFLSLEEEFSCGDFFRRANALLRDISARGRWPVVVGGAPFYLKSLLYGLPQIPPISPEIRAQLSTLSCEQLRHRLQQVDPTSASRIQPRDHQRLVRALEVFQGSGRPLSSFSPPQHLRHGLRCKLWGLCWPRPLLHQRIEQRLQQMLADGLPQEWRRLSRLGCHTETPAVKGIGYREFFTASPEQSQQEIIRRVARNTRRLAKRQQTFCRQIPGIVWLPPEQHHLFASRLQQFFIQHTPDSEVTSSGTNERAPR